MAKKQTTADDYADKPSSMEPGDAPADTTDPGEHVTSVVSDKAKAAEAGHGTVNAAVKRDTTGPAKRDKKKDRIEKYEVTRPDGSIAKVERNIETGESKVS